MALPSHHSLRRAQTDFQEISAQIRAAVADETGVEGLLKNAGEILETAASAKGDAAQDCTICVSRLGAIRILTEPAGWALPALAAEYGAAAVYRVERRGGTVRVEAWSPQGGCVLRRNLPRAPASNLSGSQNAVVRWGFGEGTVPASAEFVAGDAHDGSPFAASPDGASHYQLQRAYAL